MWTSQTSTRYVWEAEPGVPDDLASIRLSIHFDRDLTLLPSNFIFLISSSSFRFTVNISTCEASLRSKLFISATRSDSLLSLFFFYIT